MSQEEIKEKAGKMFRSAQDLASSLTDAAHQQLAATAPKLTNALDTQLDNAAKAFSDAIDAVDRRTAQEQIQLLTAYKSFLQKQNEYIERRLREKKE